MNLQRVVTTVKTRRTAKAFHPHSGWSGAEKALDLGGISGNCGKPAKHQLGVIQFVEAEARSDAPFSVIEDSFRPAIITKDHKPAKSITLSCGELSA
jgi:hypothetical protein